MVRALPRVPPARRRWLFLALGLAAQTASCSFLYGIPFLVPAMRQHSGFSLAGAGAVVAAPTIGLLLTLILWGVLADRFGERVVLAAGLGASGVLLGYGAAASPSLPMLFSVFLLAGAFTASVNAASGRVVMGWFDVAERGVAMGVRQTAQPLGVGIAAFGLPPLAEQWGFQAALWLPAGFAVVAALLAGLLVVNPPAASSVSETGDGGEASTREARSPYRGSTLWRVHGASALLVVPQFAISAFAPIYLVSTQGWSASAAGWFLGAVQVLGALGRLVSGYWSDRVGSRLRPMRALALASAAAMLLVMVGELSWPWLVLLALGLAAIISVSDNGLGFTASAEIAGLSWAGRAMGAQNTSQNIAASLTPPLLGLVIGDSRYALAYGIVAVFPLLAIGLVPVRAERASVRA